MRRRRCGWRRVIEGKGGTAVLGGWTKLRLEDKHDWQGEGVTALVRALADGAAPELELGCRTQQDWQRGAEGIGAGAGRRRGAKAQGSEAQRQRL